MDSLSTIQLRSDEEIKATENKDKALRDTALNGGLGEIISIAWAFNDENVQSVSRGLDFSEAKLLESFNFLVLTQWLQATDI